MSKMYRTSLCPCIDCWDYPDLKFPKRKVKVLNKKFCWLYPQSRQKEIKQLEPNFEECKTLYTNCDYKYESYVHDQLIFLEDMFKAHEQLTENEFDKQRILIEQIWDLSQRYMRLTEAGVCVKLYPEFLSKPAEEKTLHEFNQRLRELNLSICTITRSLDKIRREMNELKTRRTCLDYTVESPLLLGNHRIRPLEDYQEILNDLFDYYYLLICKLKCWAQLILPNDAAAIEDYAGILKPVEDKDYHIEVVENDKGYMTNKLRHGLRNIRRPCMATEVTTSETESTQCELNLTKISPNMAKIMEMRSNLRVKPKKAKTSIKNIYPADCFKCKYV